MCRKTTKSKKIAGSLTAIKLESGKTLVGGSVISPEATGVFYLPVLKNRSRAMARANDRLYDEKVGSFFPKAISCMYAEIRMTVNSGYFHDFAAAYGKYVEFLDT